MRNEMKNKIENLFFFFEKKKNCVKRKLFCFLPSPLIDYKQILPQHRLPFPKVELFSSLSMVLLRPTSLYSYQP